MTPEERLALVRTEDPDAYLTEVAGIPTIVTRLAPYNAFVSWPADDPLDVGQLTMSPARFAGRLGEMWDEAAPFGEAELDHAWGVFEERAARGMPSRILPGISTRRP